MIHAISHTFDTASEYLTLSKAVPGGSLDETPKKKVSSLVRA